MDLICKDCRQTFVFTEREQTSFAQRKWDKPIRCPECRKIHKAKMNDPYRGWESVMFPSFSRKQRHTRVHYAPHIVGGFR